MYPSSLRQTGLGKTHFIIGQKATDTLESPLASIPVTKANSSRTTKDFQILFAPDDNVRSRLLQLINKEKNAIYLAIFILTDPEIAAALCSAKKRGVTVELVTDVGCLKDRASKINQLCNSDCTVYIYNPTASTKGSSLMHHKFALFAKNENQCSWIWTGSYNFTKAANSFNQENVVVFSDNHAFAKFLDQFNRLKNRSYRYAKGTLLYS